MNTALRMAGALVIGSALTTLAVAQTAWPAKAIRIVVPYAAGGNADITARVIGRKLGESLGVPIVIDNKAGANGVIGTDMVAKAAPDGYTLLIDASAPLVISPALSSKVPYDPVKDLQPISQILNYQFVLVVPTASPITGLPDLITKAKAQPGALSYGSAGIGAGGHLAAEQLGLLTGTKFNHVPYKGSAPALVDLLGGQLAFTFDTVITSVPHLKGNRLRAFAVSGARRAGSLPQVPTLKELGYKDFDISQFVGLLAPAKTDPAIVKRLHQEIVKALKSPDVIRQLETEGGNELIGDSPEEFAAQIRDDLALYRKLVKDANIQAE